MVETTTQDAGTTPSVLEDLKTLTGDEERAVFFEQNREEIDAAVVEALCTEVNHSVWADLEQSAEIAATAGWLAEALDDDRCRARSARTLANVFNHAGKHEKAYEHYCRALELYERLGDEREAAVTRSTGLQVLSFLGEYDKVLLWEEEAREVFERLEDRGRLATLENNFASTLFRQDRWEEALFRYDFAYQEFLNLQRPHLAAICLQNIAVCHINLHNFLEALAAHEKNRAYCEENGLDRLAIRADYNIAFLYYLRGEYTRALQLYQKVRRGCEAHGDDYHQALCDLDETEIYLELNQIDDAEKLARSAYEGLDRLRMSYESAKALTNGAIALSRQGKGRAALEQLRQARSIFVRENNHLWPALIDYFQAAVLREERQPVEAIELAQSARETFSQSALAPKAVMCELLLAKLYLDLDEPERAHRICLRALTRLEGLDLPSLEHEAYLVLGQIGEALDDHDTALDAYLESHNWLEKLGSELRVDEFKISFLSDKGVVYDNLVWLTMRDPTIPQQQEKAFEYMEQARSRSLTDMMAFRSHALPARDDAQEPLAEKVRTLREELTWFYRQIDIQQMRGGEKAVLEVERLRDSARTHEDELVRAKRELETSDKELMSLQTAGVIDLPTIRESIPEDTALVEYYIARGTIFGCVVDRERLAIIPLSSAARTQEVHRRLQFQLSRSTVPAQRMVGPATLIEEATRAHLETLYEELFRPLEVYLEKDHIVVVPHGFLHYIPFHALYDGENYLIDRFSISYAPSASVFHLCQIKETAYEDRSLVLGVADERAPLIAEEVQAVAEALPNVTLLIDEDANDEALQRHGAASRFVHIATHGLFRRDNPMFSAIQLGSSRLSLFDLYKLRLSAELVVLSGCGTGLNAVVGSDELVGLTRGLLYAGAQSVLVSLWDVNDESTTYFMERFYHHLAQGTRGDPQSRRATQPAKALQKTMQDVRERCPGPYYWSPFILVGKLD